jgi:hypothetical protein
LPGVSPRFSSWSGVLRRALLPLRSSEAGNMAVTDEREIRESLGVGTESR